MLPRVRIRAFQFAIRIDSLCESIRFVKKIGLSIHYLSVFLLIYRMVSAKKYTRMHAIGSYTV